MAHPIYRFGEILRELRKGAGLTVLGAAEATEYGNYERWESGVTRVGVQHLGAIAEAFAVRDVPMFLYAWLVDRFSPTPKQGAVDLAQVNFDKTYRQLPRRTVDLGERKDWVVEPPRHADLALLYLVARYRRNQRVVLPPLARKPLPTRAADEDVLTSAYGDVVEDVVRLAARILLRAGRTDDVDARAAVANVAPMLSKPEAFEALADEIGGPLADELRRFAALLRRVSKGLSDVVAQAGNGATSTTVEELTVRLAAGDVDAAAPTFAAAIERGPLPDGEAAVVVDMQAMRASLESEIDAKVRGEVIARSAALDLDDLFDALEVVTTASRAG
jgi:transcriptional regulator with XRE-family HTH domain